MIRSTECILISQRYYALNMLFKFGIAKCKHISTPLDRNIKFRRDSGKACDLTWFRQIVGSLIYLAITRSDLSYPVRMISQFMSQPMTEHLQCSQRILRYVSGTKDMALLYRRGIDEQLVGYTDADWAGNAHNRRSEYASSLGSAAIAWSNKKQPIVALSSTEAEYGRATVDTCEVIWLKRLLRDLHLANPTMIYCDNLSSTHLAKNPIFHTRTKHIEVHYHFVREHVLSGKVEPAYVPTG